MDSYVITGKLHDDVWFYSIFKHEKLMNSTRPGLAFHDNRLKFVKEMIRGLNRGCPPGISPVELNSFLSQIFRAQLEFNLFQ